MVAKKATCPFVFAGATIGSDSTPKCSKEPPPGAGSPASATARTVDWALTPEMAAGIAARKATTATAVGARMACDYRRRSQHDNETVRHGTNAARWPPARRWWPGRARAALRARRGLLLRGGEGTALFGRAHGTRVPSALRARSL